MAAGDPTPPARFSSASETGRRATAILAVGTTLVLVLSLLLLGQFGGGGASTGAMTFSAALGSPGMASEPNGGWELQSASGLAFANASWTGPDAFDFTGTNCVVSSPSGSIPSNLSYPAFHGNLLSGTALEWNFEFLDPSAHALWMIDTLGGSVIDAIELSGPDCLGVVTSGQVIPGPVVDSSVAVAAAAAAGAATFLSDHPTGVSLWMTLFVPMPPEHGTALLPAIWWLMFTTCPPLTSDAYGNQGAQFSVSVNATTGAAVPGSVSNMGCSETSSQVEESGTPFAVGPGPRA